MALTPAQQAENDRINAQMLATQQAKRDAKMAARTTPSVGNVTPPTTTPTLGGNIIVPGTDTGLNAPVKTAPVQTGVTPTQTSPSDTTAQTTPSPGDDSIWQYDELSPEMKAQLDADPLAREQFDLIAKQGGQTITETVDKTLKSLAELRKQKDFNEDQARINLERQNISNKAGERQLLQGISDAKSNTYYSALSSAPSLVANTAAGARIQELGKQFDDFVKLNSLQGEAYTKQVAENARRIQDDLNDKLGKTLTESLQNIDRSIADGTVLTEEQLMKVYKDNKDAMLKAFPTLTNFAVQQMSDLTTNFMNTQKELRASQDTFNTNANTYNQEMSQLQGFAVDGNGQPILNTNGQQIVVPKNAPLPAQFDAKTGQLITFSTNENGTIVGNASQIQGYKPPVSETKRNVVMVDGKPYDIDQERFLDTGETTGGAVGSVPFTPPTGFQSRGANASVPVKNTGDGIEIGIPSGTKLDNTNNGGECGGLANDYGQNIAGYKRVDDTWKSKKDNVNSNVPVAGGMAMWTPGKFEDNGHIGIVEKVFPDKSFQFYDTNYVAEATTNRRIIKPGDKEYELIMKTGGFFDPSKVGGQGGDLKTLGQFMKDNQSMGPGYSEKDVARFDEKIDRFVAQGDTKSMAKAYREMLLRDTDFKKEFDNTQKFTRALDDVATMINQYEQAGKSTNALKAFAEKIARKTGMTTDTALAQLQTQMGFTLANYIRSISGTAASDVEVQRLMGNMASIGNVKDLNTALVEQARNNATSSLKSMVDTRMYGLPEELKPQVFGDIYTTNTSSKSTGGQQIETEVDFSSI